MINSHQYNMVLGWLFMSKVQALQAAAADLAQFRGNNLDYFDWVQHNMKGATADPACKALTENPARVAGSLQAYSEDARGLIYAQMGDVEQEIRKNFPGLQIKDFCLGDIIEKLKGDYPTVVRFPTFLKLFAHSYEMSSPTRPQAFYDLAKKFQDAIYFIIGKDRINSALAVVKESNTELSKAAEDYCPFDLFTFNMDLLVKVLETLFNNDMEEEKQEDLEMWEDLADNIRLFLVR